MILSILTHPCHGNYGGCLQAYALQYVLSKSIHECLYSDYSRLPQKSIKWLIKRLSHALSYLVLLTPLSRLLNKVPASFHLKNGKQFKDNYLNFLPFSLLCSKTDAWIVGSDQVWRAGYARYIQSLPFFFLNSVTLNQRKNSIAYAASFGTDEWEGTPEETEECGRLLREFKAVSVREHSGVKICKEVFGVAAVQMPDPTLLLHTEEYGKIIDSEKTWQPESKYVAAYVLDVTAGKTELLLEGASALNLQLQHLMPHANAKKRRDRFPISVPQWLRLIRDCEYFITDSFHGCVFAIIYNKPFVCLGNDGRGNARFDTLLGTFGLENRFITDATSEKVIQVLKSPINWDRANAIHDVERERGIAFLKENLSES